MKNLRKNVILSIAMIFVILFCMANSVNASANFTLSFNNTNTTNTANTAANTTNTANTTANVQLTTNTTTNTTKVNNINSDAKKDLPKTGENDVYIVSAIGAIALVIGGIAYAKSRKYDVR